MISGLPLPSLGVGVVVGIDPGTACGWAVLEADGSRIASGTWDLKPRRHEGGGMRYVRARRLLDELLGAYPGAQLAYEEVRRHAGTDAAQIYGGIVAMVSALCEERKVPYVGVPVGTVKKCATGKGNAGKPEMIAAANTTWSLAIGDADDEADALWIAETWRRGLA